MAILPQNFYEASDTWLLLVICAGSIALLTRGAGWLVNGAARLAAMLGVSKIIIGATVVSLGTTSPEAAVSVTAAWKGEPGLALANGVGSIICDTALVFGVCCCITRLPVNRFVLNRHGWLQFGSAVLLVTCALAMAVLTGGLQSAYLPRALGVAFLCLLGLYMVVSVYWARQQPAIVPTEAVPNESAAKRVAAVLRNLALLVIGLAFVLASSNVLVGSVRELCLRYHVPQDVLGVTLVAFGTSVPELATAIASIVKGHRDLLVGNVVGADILNVLFVVGASAAASPLAVPVTFFWLHFPVLILVLGLFRIYIFASGHTFHRALGLPLLAIYVAYVVLLFTYAPNLVPA